MEIINISGYIQEEKVEIAKRHLISKQLENHGVTKKQLIFSDEVIENIIDNYTRESGVRQLDKKIAKVVRNIAKKIGFEQEYSPSLQILDLIEILGQKEFIKGKYEGNKYAGVITGLAWTAAGGDILLIESSLSRGNGKLTLTGNLGEVMKESAMISLEYVKAHSDKLGIDDSIFKNWNLHIHVPEGAIPKDGPSAGITMTTSIVSAFSQRKIMPNLAMTGEMTLRGRVLPVGGIKEKILAAKRAGITDIILCKDNEKDVIQIKEIYLKGLKFHFVEDIMEVIEWALLNEKVDNPKNLIINQSGS
jgi:ATP-dependent Lon protease